MVSTQHQNPIHNDVHSDVDTGDGDFLGYTISHGD